MTYDRFKLIGLLAFSLCALGIAVEPPEAPNLIEKPEYDKSQPCMKCQKMEYTGVEPNDSFFIDERRPSVLEGGVSYQEEEELHVGGKAPFIPTKEEIVDDELPNDTAK